MSELAKILHPVLDPLLAAWPTKLAASVVLALFGPYQEAYGALLVVMTLDFVTGVSAAAKSRSLSSAIAKQKAVTKLLSYAAVLVAVYQLERAVAASPFAWGAEFTLSAALLYLIGTEALSILENVERLSGRRLRVFSGHKELAEQLRRGETPRRRVSDREGRGTDRDRS